MSNQNPKHKFAESSLKYFDFFVRSLRHRVEELKKQNGSKELLGKSPVAQKVKFANRMEGFRESFAT